MNTESVQALLVTATKPASSNGTAAKRTTPTPATQQAPAPAPAAPKVVEASRSFEHAVAAVAAQIESYLQSVDRSLEFSLDSSSGRMVIAVRDASGQLIRQIPGEEALRLASHGAGGGGPALLDVEA